MVTTVRLYAGRKEWPLDHIEVRATRQPPSGRIARIETELLLGGALDAEQQQRLHEVAARCPVTQTLQQSVEITHR
jgi:putative redox protein